MTRVLINFLGATFALCFACGGSAAVAILEWDANPETNVAGYRVYSGSASRTYGSVADVGNATAFTNDLSLGLHFLAVTAYDTERLESDFSAEVALLVVPPPPLGFESNTLVWTVDGVWQLRWTTDHSTNRQTVLTNRVSLGMFPPGATISVRRYELGATNVLSDFSAPLFFNVPEQVRAMQVRVFLEKSGGVNMPFLPFAETSFFDAASEQAFYRARLEITRAGLRLR